MNIKYINEYNINVNMRIKVKKSKKIITFISILRNIFVIIYSFFHYDIINL